MINAPFFNNSRLCLLLLILLHGTAANSQTNLVPNPGFETYAGCPNSSFSPLSVPPWIVMQYNFGSYLNVCANANLNPKALGIPYNAAGSGYNYQYAHSGNGYTGFIAMNAGWGGGKEFKSYQGVQLKRSLSTKCYYAEFYVALTNRTKLATNNIGMYITTTKQTADTNSPAKYYLPANPQVLNYGNPIIKDTQNWVRVSGVFSASGGEEYITIGNFKHDTATAIDSFNVSWYARRSCYCLDDVAVYDLDSIPQYILAGRDTSIALGDSVFIGSNSGGLQNAVWYNSSGAIINTGVPGFWVKPTASTYYVLQLSVCNSFRQDTVRVTVGTVPLKFISITASPTPPREGLINVKIDWVTANEINVSHFNIQRSTNGKDFTTIGTQKANNKSYNEYNFVNDLTRNEKQETWYYRIESVDKDGKKQYSETRTLNLKPETLNGVSIYPNPAKDVVTISSKEKIASISIINQLGQVVQQLQVNKELLKVDVRQLNAGLYLLKIVTQKNIVYNEKFIKQ